MVLRDASASKNRNSVIWKSCLLWHAWKIVLLWLLFWEQYSPCDKINYFWWSSIFDQPDNCRRWANPSETSSWSTSLLLCYCSRYLPKLNPWPWSTLVSGTRWQSWRRSRSSILLHWRRTKWQPWPWVWKKLRWTDNFKKVNFHRLATIATIYAASQNVELTPILLKKKHKKSFTYHIFSHSRPINSPFAHRSPLQTRQARFVFSRFNFLCG